MPGRPGSPAGSCAREGGRAGVDDVEPGPIKSGGSAHHEREDGLPTASPRGRRYKVDRPRFDAQARELQHFPWPRPEHRPALRRSAVKRQERFAMRYEEDLAHAGQMLVLPKLLAVIVLLGRGAGDLDEHDGVDDRQRVVGRALRAPAHDRDVAGGRESGRLDSYTQVGGEGPAALGEAGRRRVRSPPPPQTPCDNRP